MPDPTRRRIHDQPRLCEYILSLVADSSVPLRIAASSIGSSAGTGLFAVDDVSAGTDIFRSQPLLVVSEGNKNGMCDYCFVNKNSSVAPGGTFYMDDVSVREKTKISACTGCKNAQYCSKECQRKAWRSYHKYECPVIHSVKEHNKNMGTLPQALCRLILWIDNGAISKRDFEAIVNLETHCDERNDQWQRKYGDGDDAPLEETFLVAHNVTQAAKSNMDWKLAAELYCMLMTNAGAICPPELDDQYGSFLDLVVSVMNHSCDANAHTFFEGRELRCRALRDIPAGTEITVNYYPTPRYDVLLRRNTLKDYMFITCSCKRCKDEMAEHVAAAVNRQDHLATLRKAQLDLEKVGDDAEKAFRFSRTVKVCISFQDRIGHVLQQGYPDGNWPHHIEPLPTIYRTLGRMYRDLHYVLGLEFLLKGTLYLRERGGPSWVLHLEHVVKFMVFLAQAGDDDIKWTAATRGKDLVQRVNMRDVARGYLCLACVDSKFTFGLDAAYARAMHDFAGHSIDCYLDPKIDTDEFRGRFRDSQERILKWAGVKPDRALALPSRERIAELRRDIERVWGGKVPQVKWPSKTGDDDDEQGGVEEDLDLDTKVGQAVRALSSMELGSSAPEK